MILILNVKMKKIKIILVKRTKLTRRTKILSKME